MNQIISRIEDLIDQGVEQFSRLSEMELTHKPAPGKWSRQEILGHLIDSGINNLQRFTEIQFFEKPYKIREYRQDELVKANDYQNADLKGFIDFWRAINCRIMTVIRQQTEKTLSYQIVFDDQSTSDLRFLIQDYVDHLEHHLDQISKNRSAATDQL